MHIHKSSGVERNATNSHVNGTGTIRCRRRRRSTAPRDVERRRDRWREPTVRKTRTFLRSLKGCLSSEKQRGRCQRRGSHLAAPVGKAPGPANAGVAMGTVERHGVRRWGSGVRGVMPESSPFPSLAYTSLCSNERSFEHERSLNPVLAHAGPAFQFATSTVTPCFHVGGII
jgi:hypothetical protein